MKTYRQLSLEQYPIPEGVYTKKQTEYYKRIQAIQICAFRDGAKAILRIDRKSTPLNSSHTT